MDQISKKKEVRHKVYKYIEKLLGRELESIERSTISRRFSEYLDVSDKERGLEIDRLCKEVTKWKTINRGRRY